MSAPSHNGSTSRIRTAAYFLSEATLSAFISEMIKQCPVISPVEKKGRFVYSELNSAADLRLDFDVTLLPPKKVFFPPRQELFRFGPGGFESSLVPRKRILFGVHPYDLRAIEMLDQLFTEGISDVNYLAHRHATTIIGSSVMRHSSRSFYGSMIRVQGLRGHDGFFTPLPGGYLYEVRSAAGEALLKHGAFRPATAEQVSSAEKFNQRQAETCPERISENPDVLSARVRASFKDAALWDGLSEKCFSCGSCVMVCPTCYCFDVQDEWNIGQEAGVRFRAWDGCMLQDFAKVSLGAGGSENFREKKGQRYRHRIMRKFAYQNRKLTGPACVGCGRCSSSCVPDIASPVKAVNRILGGAR